MLRFGFGDSEGALETGSVHSGARFGYMQEEEVVDLAKCGHQGATEFLISRFRPLVENKARAYFVMGADREDVIQEGMIGLYKAIRDFRSDRLNRFRPFAELCVTRQIITAVKTATRQKHVPLNGYVSLNRPCHAETADSTLMDVLPSVAGGDPVAELLGGRLPKHIDETVTNALSDLERQVLACYLDGLSYREMSSRLDCHPKSIDNALQRVKRKIGTLLKE
ncbi:MAG: RNA polymerase sporulation sigma factor SigH [Chlorobia bacterium]|nr:RNA polymerase sporulation sigma factor SigH [Fimbriimonadaceae bacterium]